MYFARLAGIRYTSLHQLDYSYSLDLPILYIAGTALAANFHHSLILLP